MSSAAVVIGALRVNISMEDSLIWTEILSQRAFISHFHHDVGVIKSFLLCPPTLFFNNSKHMGKIKLKNIILLFEKNNHPIHFILWTGR